MARVSYSVNDYLKSYFQWVITWYEWSIDNCNTYSLTKIVQGDLDMNLYHAIEYWLFEFMEKKNPALYSISLKQFLFLLYI